MIDRRILGYFSMLFIPSLVFTLIYVKEYFAAAALGMVYLVFIFGIDKFKITKNSIEIEDEHKD